MRWPQQNSGDPSTPRPGPSAGVPPLFSPGCSRGAFPEAASAAAVSEHPYVELAEWWLARVEGHERKIAVGGFFERNQAVLNFPAAPIAKCHNSHVLESEDGTVVTISGSFNIIRALENGFTIEKGKALDSLATQWWNDRNKTEAFSGRDHAFPDSSSFPNGASRFEEYISDDDTATAASNHDDSEVKDMETVLTGASTFEEQKSHEGIDSNVPSAYMVECTNGEGNVGVGIASSINNGLQKTHVSSLKRQCCLKKPEHVTLSGSVPGEAIPSLPSSKKGEQPVGPSRKKRSSFGKLQHATRFSNITCPSPNGNLSLLIRSCPNSLPVSTPESLKLKKTRSGRVVVPPLDPGCQNIIYAPDGSVSVIIGLDLSPPLKGSMLKNYARKKKRSN